MEKNFIKWFEQSYEQIVEIYLTISSYFINNPFTKIEN